MPTVCENGEGCLFPVFRAAASLATMLTLSLIPLHVLAATASASAQDLPQVAQLTIYDSTLPTLQKANF